MPTSNSSLISVVCNVYLLAVYFVKCISSIWHTDIQNNELCYDQAARWTSHQMVLQHCDFLSAFALVILARKITARYVPWFCLVLAGLAMMAIPMVDNKYVLFLPMVGIGIT